VVGPLRRNVILGFAGALVLLIAADAVSYHTLRRMLETGDAVSHSHRVLERLDWVLLRLQDAETGQRGYLITGDPDYLAPYETAVRAIDQELARLDSLLAGAAQADRLQPLRGSVAAKLWELNQTIAARRGGRLDRAAAIVRSGRGKRLMDDIRDQVNRMRAAEHERLTRHRDGSAAGAQATFWFLGLGSLLGLLLISFAFTRINRDILRRLRAEQGLQQAHDELETRVGERTTQLALANAELARSRDELLSVFN
jgi:CHASE3 domain sensor protein